MNKLALSVAVVCMLGVGAVAALSQRANAAARTTRSVRPPPRPQPPAQPQPGLRVRLGEWNMKKLGHGTTKRYDLLARVIEANFDIVVLVEVMQLRRGHPGYERLLAELGGAWAAQVTDSPRPRTGSGNSEFYAIAWRRSLVRPCNGWQALRYATDNDGGPNGTGVDNFVREPAFGCFEAIRNQTRVFDFMLGAFHATFQGAPAIRAEAGHLGDVFQRMEHARPGEHDLWLLGDYNLTSTNLARAVTFADRTEGAGSTLNSRGNVTRNLYDHFLVQDVHASTELHDNAQVLDVRSVASSPTVFYRNVSDHLPIVAEVAASRDDD